MGLRQEIRLQPEMVEIDDLGVNGHELWLVNIVPEPEQTEKILDFNGMNTDFVISTVIALQFKGVIFPAERGERKILHLELVLKDGLGAVKKHFDIRIDKKILIIDAENEVHLVALRNKFLVEFLAELEAQVYHKGIQQGYHGHQYHGIQQYVGQLAAVEVGV
jgi:hypothetical protein